MISLLNRSLLFSLRHSSMKHFSLNSIRLMSSHHSQHPLMLMDIPRIAAPNLISLVKNFLSRLLINGYFDSTFAMKPFCEGARQALTVVSNLVSNGQFEDLPGFVTQQVINEVKQNYSYLSPQQRQQILVEDSEIVFTCPYSIGLILDEQTNTRLIEITMIFHILKDQESYREEMMQNSNDWMSTIRKMRDNIIICNYKFLRDVSKHAKDTSWIITELNHWLPNEYFEQPSNY